MPFAFTWWAWAVFGLALGTLEMLAPAFVLLGFGIGALGVSGLLLVFGPGLFGMSVTWMMVVFGILSLAAWIGLRQIFKLPEGQVKNFETDIND